MRNLGKINPETLSDLQNKVLYFYLLKNKAKIYFVRNERMKINLNGKLYSFELSNDIFYRKSDGGVVEDRFEVLADAAQLDSGGMGRVYKIAGTLAPTKQDRLEFKKHIKRVVKAIDFKKKETEEFCLNEIKLTKKIYHRGVKNLVVMPDSKFGLIVMHELEGENLIDIIDKDLKGQNPLTLDRRIHISTQILLALEKIHNANVIHRDVKPDNIFMNETQATLFDFGLSKEKGQKVREAVGTPQYAPPEQYADRESDERSDMFSMAVIMAFLWKIRLKYPAVDKLKQTPTFHQAKNQDDLLAYAYLESSDKIEFNFDDFDCNPEIDISDTAKDNIKSLIKNTINVDPNNRFTMDKMLAVFHGIRLEKKLANLQDIYFQVLPDVHHIAMQARTKYKKMIYDKTSISFTDIQEIIEKSFNHHAFSNDDPILVEEFTTVLGIEAFKELRSKASILEKITTIKTELEQNVDHLHNIKEKLAALQKLSEQTVPKNLLLNHLATLLNKECTVILQKNLKVNLDIDGMVVLNLKYKQALEKFKLSNPVLSTLIELGSIVKDIQENVYGQSTPAYQIKMAIWAYINQTFTVSNIRKKAQAVSAQRMSDMHELIKILNAKDQSTQQMLQTIKVRLNKFKRGVFNTNFPLFKHMGGSDLIDLVNEAIKKINQSGVQQQNKKRRLCW